LSCEVECERLSWHSLQNFLCESAKIICRALS
jgi:hypothetical protein